MMKSSNAEHNIKNHYLYPSALFADKEPYIVDTILGSCIAVCLYDEKRKIGGINHFMLPFWNGSGLASPKYGNIAIEKLVEKMIALGSNMDDMKAKVFGGGEVVETQSNHFRIGERNIEMAEKMLSELNIRVLGRSVGGKLGRKIRFNTETGVVLMKFIKKQTV